MTPRRDDLLAMNTDVLVAMTNRGIVNRALREVASSPPRIDRTEHGIRAIFDTGHTVELSDGLPLAESTCTCGSTTLCRHRIGMVLAYQNELEHPDGGTDWSPGEFTDDELLQHYGARVMNRARRDRQSGYTAMVHRPVSGNSVTRVELPRATVRFLVAHDLDHAYTSATDRYAPTTVVLAVWAVRVADEAGADAVHIGDDRGGADGGPSPGSAAGAVVDSILRAGASNVTGSLRAALYRNLADLAATQQTWIIDATTDLLDAVDARGARHSRFSRRRMSELLVEVHNRSVLDESGTALIASNASGVDVAPETPIRRTTFTGLGARRTAITDPPGVDIFLYDRSARSVCVWHQEARDSVPTYEPGSRTYLIASGTVISNSAVRLAGNGIRFSRVGQKSMSLFPPDPQIWKTLGDVYVTDYSFLRALLDHRLPSFARPRNAVESLFVLETDHIGNVEYNPGDQTLRASIFDSFDNRATLETEYRADCAAALDEIADALRNKPTEISGMVRLSGGELIVDPYAMVVDGVIEIPQLAPDAPRNIATVAPAREPDPIPALIDSALDLLGELAERGLEQPHIGSADNVDGIAQQASSRGMRDTAQALTSLGRALREVMVEQRCDAWLHVATRLLVASENL